MFLKRDFQCIAALFCIVLVCTSCTSLDNYTHIDDRFHGYYKVGKPYEIDGKTYYPKEETDYDEVGVSSWYGDDFHGKLTANGDIYDQFSLTAAHRTLPLPSIVRVTNLDNGKTLILMVNDRGPFAKDRIIDVSSRASEILGFQKQGVANVRVQFLEGQTKRLLASMPQSIGKAKKPPFLAKYLAAADLKKTGLGDQHPIIKQRANHDLATVPTQASFSTTDHAPLPLEPNQSSGVINHFIQAGTFGVIQNAKRVQNTLQSIGNVMIKEIKLEDQPLYRVRLGPIKDKNMAQAALKQIIKLGHTDAMLTHE